MNTPRRYNSCLDDCFNYLVANWVFRDRKVKNCYLQRSVTPLVKPHNFMHPDDHFILEDESGRVKLGGSVLCPSIYVSGLYHEQNTFEKQAMRNVNEILDAMITSLVCIIHIFIYQHILVVERRHSFIPPVLFSFHIFSFLS